ncbi:MAG: hypothetical protein COU06_01045 [Candidatus Harrisonbacteria bacterium CG10_big_fil_rev_8_21_14_0_10_38_8]|uniref:HTH cro/C1-type domain-containing protein n=1 Tax=Candidatus Harrisonbacteria bacterium CG10_big_fil_rev_8_21_14_0_10_38_8 TaxID=1974582 RepID=A0A2M6WKC2_9BACT|nr:MAG: hypothetical protein COU06_01045 [Candidatus Harrisonbacteria bacterium CG10_big_fil_rev_8_21_14_0_10_38_8]
MKTIKLKNLEIKRLPRNEELAVDIGIMISKLRILRSLTQSELAKKINTKQSSIARVENGASLPSLSFLFKIAQACKTEINPPTFQVVEMYDDTLTTVFKNPAINSENLKEESYKEFEIKNSKAGLITI